MNQYNLTAIRPYRLTICLFLFPVLSAIFINFLGKMILSGVFFYIAIGIFEVILFFSIYYFCAGKLVVKVIENNIIFEWVKKPLLNFKKIVPIKFEDIRTIVIDTHNESLILRKIVTKDSTIKLFLRKFKLLRNDTELFFGFLKGLSKNKNYDIKMMDSWDLLAEKGLLKRRYIFFKIVSYISLAVIILSVIRGNYASTFFMTVGATAYLFSFQAVIKRKLDLYGNKKSLNVSNEENSMKE